MRKSTVWLVILVSAFSFSLGWSLDKHWRDSVDYDYILTKLDENLNSGNPISTGEYLRKFVDFDAEKLDSEYNRTLDRVVRMLLYERAFEIWQFRKYQGGAKR